MKEKRPITETRVFTYIHSHYTPDDFKKAFLIEVEDLDYTILSHTSVSIDISYEIMHTVIYKVYLK